MRKVTIALLAALTLGLTATAGAQVASTLQSISLQAVKGQSVTLGAPSPALQSLTLADNAINPYTTPFSITVSWNVTSSNSTMVRLVGYFATPAQALANGTEYIASSRIETSTNGGGTWSPVTGAAVGGVGTTGGSVLLYTSPVTQGVNSSGTATVTFLIRINLTGAPTTAAGIYSGTLNLMAICF